MAASYSFLLLVALSGLACVLSKPANDWKPPKFCNKLDCPRYNVIRTTKDYEQRKYEVSSWVTTEDVAMDYERSTRDMFGRLFRYISGENADKKKVAMTAPVLVKVIAGQGPACNSNFTMGFYVAPSEAETAPVPTDTRVKLAGMPEQVVYTKQFSGYATIEDFIRVSVELINALPADAKVDKTHFYTAGYDSPYKPFDRHNEVWFTAL